MSGRKWDKAGSEEIMALIRGRTRYNAEIKRQRDARRAKLLSLIMSGQVRPDQHSRIMELLDVASTTAWRDKTAVVAQIEKDNVCPHCGRPYAEELLGSSSSAE